MSEGEQGDSLQRKTESFLREFFEKGEVLVRELILENERLRAQVTVARDPSGTEENAGPEAAGSERVVVRMLMDRVGKLESELDEIRRIAGSVEIESSGYQDRLESLEQEHYNLACMYVAGLQFHTGTTFEDTLRTVTEILLNFVGVGRFSIYGVDEERQMLFPLAREGGAPEELDEMAYGDGGPAAGLAGLGRAWKGGDPTFELDGELVFMPLYSGSRLVGAARLESFLEQKTGFSDSDDQLLALVSEHAGIGLEVAWVRAHAEEGPMVRAAIEELVGS